MNKEEFEKFFWRNASKELDGYAPIGDCIEEIYNIFNKYNEKKETYERTVGGFGIVDIRHQAKNINVTLTKEQEIRVLERMDKYFDANIGMAWDLVELCIKEIIKFDKMNNLLP